jgi:DNA gyrase/topoisomerase IV subunit B
MNLLSYLPQNKGKRLPMTELDLSYEDGSIATLKGLAIMRQSPSAYLPDAEHRGISHLIIEALDNSGDEVLLKGEHGQIEVMLCPDPKRQTVQVIIGDNGRGIPLGDMWRALTQPSSSGKFNPKGGAYQYSSGQFGVGGKVTAGLSQDYRAISYRGKDGYGSLHVHKGDHPDENVWTKKYLHRDIKTDRTGVLTILEPDSDIFTGVESYCPEGWFALIERMKKYAFFHPLTNIKFYQSSKPLPSNVWTVDLSGIDKILKDTIANSAIIFDSRTFDRESWLNNYLGVSKPFVWSHHFIKHAEPPNDSLMCDIRILYHDKDTAAAKLGMVNSVPIDHGSSNHISELLSTLKERLETQISDKAIRTFFKETYRLPIYLTVNVKYQGAKFSGTTKDAFFSQKFRDDYNEYLNQYFTKTAEGKASIEELYALLEPDITEKYLASINGASVVKVENRLFKDLANPNKFANCFAKDRSEATLFLVEGDSAGRGVAKLRDGETMGIYYMKGKSLNGFAKWGRDQISREIRKKKYGTYHDILKILKLDPDNPNLNSLYYNKLVIMTDAD